MKSNTHDIQEMYLYFLSTISDRVSLVHNILPTSSSVVGPNSMTEININSCTRNLGPSFRTVSRKNGTDFW
jgi:hypothetical protein